MRTVIALAAAALLAGQALIGPSLAAGTAPLAPGKPAGIKKAQVSDENLPWYLIGGAAVVAGIAILASDNGNSPAAASTPTTTNTTTSTSTSTST
jgi:hypothetical protein